MNTPATKPQEPLLPESGIFLNTIPVLDSKDSVWGYFVDFMSANGERIVRGAHIAAITNSTDPSTVIGGKKAIVAIDEHDLDAVRNGKWERQMILRMPAGHIVRHVTQAGRPISAATIFCITDFAAIETVLPLLPSPVYVTMDIEGRGEGELLRFMRTVKGKAVTAIATSVNTFRAFELCARAGFHLFQGEFFARPDTTRRLSISPSHSLLLELSAQVAQNADIAKIEAIFKKNPDLAAGLINLVHSAYFRTSQDIFSIRQAIAALGYQNIDKWVALMLFSINGSDPWSNPLFERAFLRAHTMELLTRSTLGLQALGDVAYLVGILSLMPLIFNVTIEEVLAKANVTRDMKQALLDREGMFGTFLSIIEKFEEGEYELIRRDAARLGLNPATVLSARTDAIKEYHTRAIGQRGHEKELNNPAVPTNSASNKQDPRGHAWFHRLFHRKRPPA